MSQRAQALAERFATVNEELIRTIESCSEAELDCVTAGEGWPVRVAAHHIAVSHEPVASLAQLVATSQPLPELTQEMFDHGNAQHAAEHATVGKQVILDTLQSGGAKAQTIVNELSDEDLDRSGHIFNSDLTAESIIENILIGHANGHMASIKAAVGK